MCRTWRHASRRAATFFRARVKPSTRCPSSDSSVPAACIDISQQCTADPDYQAKVEDFEGWELVQGGSLEDRIVLIRTGFSRFWPDRKTYLGTEEQGKEAVAKLHFPGLDPAAADWLVSKRHVRLVGIDTASIDHGQTADYPTHRRLFHDNVPAIENLVNLAQLPSDDFSIVALPMKIAGGSGDALPRRRARQ